MYKHRAEEQLTDPTPGTQQSSQIIHIVTLFDIKTNFKAHNLLMNFLSQFSFWSFFFPRGILLLSFSSFLSWSGDMLHKDKYVSLTFYNYHSYASINSAKTVNFEAELS